jgi:hypothetical protein
VAIVSEIDADRAPEKVFDPALLAGVSAAGARDSLSAFHRGSVSRLAPGQISFRRVRPAATTERQNVVTTNEFLARMFF